MTGSAPHGTKYFRLTRLAGGDSYAYYTTPTVPPPNSPYTLSFWTWGDNPRTLNDGLAFRTYNNGACCANFGIINGQMISTTPTRIVMSGNTPANPTTGLQIILRTTSTIGENVYYDGFMITEGLASYNYADGSSNGWTWNGTANNSTSTGPPL